MVGSKPPGTEGPTAELPGAVEPEEPKLSTSELEMVTADTLKFPEPQASQFAAESEPAKSVSVSEPAPKPVSVPEPVAVPKPAAIAQPAFVPDSVLAAESAFSESKMDSQANRPQSASLNDTNDILLDLDDFEPAATSARAPDDYILDLDLDEPEPVSAPVAYPASFAEPQRAAAAAVWEDSRMQAVKRDESLVYGEPLAGELMPDDSSFERQSYRP